MSDLEAQASTCLHAEPGGAAFGEFRRMARRELDYSSPPHSGSTNKPEARDGALLREVVRQCTKIGTARAARRGPEALEEAQGIVGLTVAEWIADPAPSDSLASRVMKRVSNKTQSDGRAHRRRRRIKEESIGEARPGLQAAGVRPPSDADAFDPEERTAAKEEAGQRLYDKVAAASTEKIYDDWEGLPENRDVLRRDVRAAAARTAERHLLRIMRMRSADMSWDAIHTVLLKEALEATDRETRAMGRVLDALRRRLAVVTAALVVTLGIVAAGALALSSGRIDVASEGARPPVLIREEPPTASYVAALESDRDSLRDELAAAHGREARLSAALGATGTDREVQVSAVAGEYLAAAHEAEQRERRLRAELGEVREQLAEVTAARDIAMSERDARVEELSHALGRIEEAIQEEQRLREELSRQSALLAAQAAGGQETSAASPTAGSEAASTAPVETATDEVGAASTSEVSSPDETSEAPPPVRE